MRTTSISISILALLITVAAKSVSAQEKSQEKKRETAAVLDFKAGEGLNKNEANTLTNKFRSALAKTKVYDVLERTEMETVLKEQDMSLTDLCDNAECAVQVGKLLVAKKMVVGEIGKIGPTYSLTVRIIDVSTGKVDVAENQTYKGAVEGLLDVFDVLAQKITGTYKTSHTLLYVIGGVAVLGGGAAVILGGSKKAAAAVSTALGGINDLPLPPH
jgi:curli biogenesis system outer membrane secretion channel CsgG